MTTIATENSVPLDSHALRETKQRAASLGMTAAEFLRPDPRAPRLETTRRACRCTWHCRRRKIATAARTCAQSDRANGAGAVTGKSRCRRECDFQA